MFKADVIDNYIEEKLMHLHTAFLAKVLKAESPTNIDVQPLTLTQQLGKEPKKQAILTGIICLNNAWEYISKGSIVLCITCERDTTQARLGKVSLPSLGRHEMKDSIIIGSICGKDQQPIGFNSLNEDEEDFQEDKINKLFREAEKYIGMKYVFGANPPRSFDCSGYVCWVFSNSGLKDLSYTNAQGLYEQCIKINQKDAKTGDLVFFTDTYKTNIPVTHVGIYSGNSKMIHCGNTIKYTSIDNDYWSKHLYGFASLPDWRD